MPTDHDAYDAFADRLRSLVEGERMERAQQLTTRYWTEGFTGQYFHEFADDDNPNEFTERDFIVVSMLGVTIPAPVSIWLRSNEGGEQVRELLEPVPLDVDIWDAGDMLGHDRELWRLWDLLDHASWPESKPGNDMGRTKISKLLAAKRPRLVPIYDSVLDSLLPNVPNYWTAFERALSDEKLRLMLAIAAASGAPEGATLLRKVDAMLWMIGKEPNW